MENLKLIQDPEIKYKKLFINNEWVDAVSGKTYPVINPATAKKIADVAEADKADVDKAVESAKKAFALGSPWRTMDASQRGDLLYKLASLMERDLAYLSSLETLNNGKTFYLPGSLYEIDFGMKVIKYYAGWADKIQGKTIPINGKYLAYTRHEPVGVCGQIIPWNFPILMATWKLGPALAAGNVVVMKPSELTPLTALYLCSLIKEAGFPPGVVNMVPGFGSTCGSAISNHPGIDKVAFTGSTEVGKLIMQAASTNIKRTTLELGGKSPCVIFDDVDIDKVVADAQDACMINAGQCCIAATRTYVHENIYDEFVARSRELAKKRKIGDPFDPTTQNGPQINEKQMNKILDLIEKGKKEGAKLEAGGERHGTVGYFVKPTVFSNVTDDMCIAREEIFGPVQQILKFKTLDEVIQRANDSNYGLGSAIYTNDINKALTFSNSIKAGTCWINCYMAMTPQGPFGGFKESGFGRELGEYAIQNYYEVKYVCAALLEKNS